MSKIVWLFFFIIISHGTAAAQNIFKLNSGTLSTLYDIAFTDEKNGFAVGGSGTLLQTADSGKTWRAVAVPSRDSLKKILFADANRGWILCEKARYATRGGEPLAYLLKTEDGGANWTREEIGDTSNLLLTQIFLDRRGDMFAVGETGAILRRSDEKGWRALKIESRFLLLDGAFADERNGVIVGGGNTILHSEDGGQIWQRISVGDTDSAKLFAVAWQDAQNGAVVGAKGGVYITNNGGARWTKKPNLFGEDLRDVKFISKTNFIAVGSGGTVIFSEDGAKNWRQLKSPVTHNLNGLYISGNNAFVVGFGGVILRVEL